MSKRSRVTLCVFAVCLALSMTGGYVLQAMHPDFFAAKPESKSVIHVGSTPVEVRNMIPPSPPPSIVPASPTEYTAKPVAALPRFRSLDELMGVIKQAGGLSKRSTVGGINNAIPEAAVEDAGVASAPAGGAVSPSSEMNAGSDDHSQVNSQVEGVSEGDISVTDGRYLYVGSMQRQSLLIVETNGADMKQVVSIPLSDAGEKNDQWLQEMYINGDYLVTVTSRSEYLEAQSFDGDSAGAEMCIWYPSRQFTRYTVYDVSDRSRPEVTRSFEVEGNAVSTRMVGNHLYFVTTRYLYSLYMEDMGEADILPLYRDTSENGKYQVVPVTDIYYFPDSQDMTYMFVGAFDITGDEPASMDSYVGAGEQIYMCAESLYVARSLWKENQQTQVYRFSVDGTDVSFTGEAAIKGYLLNQYSMDEYNGIFRVAITDRDAGNYVYTLNADTMQGLGRTEALAPDEQIQSVRFMGDMAYVVTFRQTDPLFAIDLSDPHSPEVLGELKIPGFSTYLHPVGDGLLVGFGRNVLETYVDTPGGGREVVGTLDIGMKISLFDVSDPKNPLEIDVLALERNSHSTAIYNPRALMIDKKRGVFGFNQVSYDNRNIAGYRLISVLDRKLMDYGFIDDSQYDRYDSFDNRRLCYIGDTLYGISDGGVAAYDYRSLELLNRLRFS